MTEPIRFRPITPSERQLFLGAEQDVAICAVEVAMTDVAPEGFLLQNGDGYELVVWSEDGESVGSYIHALVADVNTILQQPITLGQLAHWQQIL